MTMQPPQAANNQAYGMKNEQLQAQKQIPLPQADGPGGGAPGPSPAGAPPPTQPVDVVAAARDFDPGITPLSAPSQRPGEPVTTGLALGAGAGPEIFSQPTQAMKTADMLDMLAQTSGNDAFRNLALRIRQSGGFR